jgi:hypothetical protein
VLSHPSQSINSAATIIAIAFPLFLGATGFFFGFVGPIILNPSANQGPMLGIFITGPAAFVIGAFLGSILAMLHVRPKFVSAIFIISAFLVATSTLYMGLPEDRYQGFIIDAEVYRCNSPALLLPEAIRQYAISKNESPWNTPSANWKSDIPVLSQNDKGIVLTLVIHRKREIYEQRKPWNKGRLIATKWKNLEIKEDYFLRNADCNSNLCQRGYRSLYSPQWEIPQKSHAIPLPSFLGIYTLQEVPARFRQYAR